MFLPKDDKETLAIERRRQREEERKKRIMDPKLRMFGVDTKALDSQVEVKKKIAESEKKVDEYYADLTKTFDQQAQLLDIKQQQLKVELATQVDEYRKKYQNYDKRREYDLNRPDYLKIDKPPRIGDEDMRNGIASGQKFFGEDLNIMNRVKAQQEELKKWVEEQTLEKSVKKNQELLETLEYQKKVSEINQNAVEIEKKNEELRVAKLQETLNTNKILADIKQQQADLKKKQDEEDSKEHVQNVMNSDFLNEKYENTFNVLDPMRFKPDHFKSLRPDQFEDIEKQRIRQLEEKKLAEDIQKKQQEIYDLEQWLLQRKAMEIEREKKNQKKKLAEELLQTQKVQEEEFKLTIKKKDEIYENRVYDDFFSKFGTSSR